MKKIGWGVLSTARIGTTKVIPAIAAAASSRLVAISSRTHEAAQKAADQLGFERAYDNYAALLDDPEVEAVYIPLPNHLHVEWALNAVEKGKHVLCEKPIALNRKELEPLAIAAEKAGVVVAEAFMVRHHPQWQKVREIIQSGVLGQIQAVRGVFGYFNDDPNNIRNAYQQGGGALYDVGVYPIVTSRYALGEEPNAVMAKTRLDKNFGVDVVTSGMLSYPQCECSFMVCTQMQRHQSMDFFGSRGRLSIELPYNPELGGAAKLMLDTEAKGREAIEIPTCNQFQLQAEAFARYVRGEEQNPFPLSDSLQMMTILDGLFASAEQGRWINL